MRFTKNVCQQLLEVNEGFTMVTYRKLKNLTEEREYEISGGKLRYRSSGKGSWGGSRFNDPVVVADDEQTRRFLQTYLHRLKTDGVE